MPRITTTRDPKKTKRRPGSARGQIQILDDFDTPDLNPDFNVPIKIEPDQPGGSISFVVKDKTGQVVSVMTFTNVSIEQIRKK